MTTLLDQLGRPAHPTMEMRMRAVAKAASDITGVHEADILSRCRRESAVAPRRVACYVIRQVTGASYKAIGKALGLDHTTVLHHVRQVEIRMQFDEWTRNFVQMVMIEVCGPDLLAIES